MKTGFKEPNAIKGQKPKDKPVDGKKSPWDFTCPQYDERTGRGVEAGTHYGVGINQPVGHTGPAKQDVSCLPRGRVSTMRDDVKG